MDEKKDTVSKENGQDDSELRKEILSRFRAVEKHYAEWNKEAKEDFAFALGDQWDEKDRQALKEQGRPCLTFNRIAPILNLVGGHQRENAARIKVNPEGGEDKVFSEVCDKAMHFIDKTSHLTYKLGYQFDDGTHCGKGFVEAILTYDGDPIRGEVRFKQLTPYQVLVDPDCREYDLNEGARYLFKVVRMAKSDLLGLYPKKKDLINGFKTDVDDFMLNGEGLVLGEDNDYGNDKSKPDTQQNKSTIEDTPDLDGDQKYTLKEYWRKKWVTRYYVIDKESGDPEKFEKKEDAEAFVAKQGFGKVIERQVTEMWVAAMVAGHIIQDIKSQFEPYYNGFPFFRFMAEWAPNADTEVLRVQGMVRKVKDPQREKNKSKSQYLHILNTQANSGWISDDNALTDEGFRQLEQMGAKPGIVIKKKPGSDMREILPKGPNSGHTQREMTADEEFKQILGINPDLMGFQDGTASGRAIAMRVKQAIMALVRIFQNYRYTKEIVGNFILKIIPMIFDEKKLRRVLGPKYMRSVVDPELYPQGLEAGHIAAFLIMIKDNRYDVIVTEADQNTSIRYETLQDLTELVKAGSPIPPDLIIDFMDIPNADEVKAKIQAYQQQMAAANAAKGK